MCVGRLLFSRRNAARLQHMNSHFAHRSVVEKRNLETTGAALQERSRWTLWIEIELGFEGFEVAGVEEWLVHHFDDALKKFTINLR